MAINAVAPWEGELTWKGEVNKGKTASGAEWKSMEFTLKYEDSHMDEKYMTFSVFGVGKVNQLSEYPIGTQLKVLWWPASNQGKNGKWYPKNDAISIFLADSPAKSADTKITTPSFPQQKEPEAWKNPLPKPGYSDDLPGDSDLPF